MYEITHVNTMNGRHIDFMKTIFSNMESFLKGNTNDKDKITETNHDKFWKSFW